MKTEHFLPLALILVAGCSNQHYVRTHGPCTVSGHYGPGRPEYYGGTVHVGSAFTEFECHGVRVYVDDVNGKRWRP